MSNEAKRCALDAAVERNSSLPEPGGFRRWISTILTVYEQVYRRTFLGPCVTGLTTSRVYFALLRFWR